jgi:hypothetical protein
MARVVGIVALFVLTACSQSSTIAGPSPTPILPQGSWTQNLTFNGELTGQMTGIIPNTLDQQSECTGSRTHNGETWADSFFGTIDTSGNDWQVIFLLNNFRGPGTYTNSDANIQVESPDASQAWLNLDADKVTFTVDRGQQSGSIDAQLTNATSGKAAAVHLVGSWNCRG